MNKELLLEMIDAKLVSVQKHPEADLFIHNYNPRVQYERLWNEVTLQTRGLILDGQGNTVARPFRKFFNLEEHAPEEIPLLPFQVFDKLDGSLGILYWHDGKPFIATRGSFTSDQARHATALLYDKYAHTFSQFKQGRTYLFEIIFPANRIVVDYGTTDDLFLLAVIDNQTGRDLPLEEIGFPVVRRFDGINELSRLRELEETNKEGFVVLFENGFRVKMKFSEYVRLHRIITGVSNVAIWEYLSEGKPFDELLEKVPDEFYDWVTKTSGELREGFERIHAECRDVYREFPTRKEAALYFQTQKYPSILFSLLDGRPPDKIIWKLLRPTYCRPFKTET